MAALPPLTEALVRALASAESFRRGREYYQRGAVERLVRRGDHIEAEVAGSDYEPYQVTATLGPTGVTAEDCTCPYDWGGACKHVVAALLAVIESPDAVEDRPPLDTVLASLDREQLQRLLLTLATADPSLTARIEVQAAVLAAAPKAATKGQKAKLPPPAIDPKDLRRQVRGAVHSLHRMRSSEAYWHLGGVARDVVQVGAQARPFFEGGDVQTALTLLEAVTEEYLEVWSELDDSDGEASGPFHDLGELWAEALLSGDLPAEERDRWEDRLAEWRNDLEDYGVDDAFFLAETALEEGWDHPALVRILRGEAATDDEPPAADPGPVHRVPALIVIRLRVLERQGRTEEYLRLAQATGHRAQYSRMLVALGRGAEAVEYGMAALAAPAEALALAQALQAQGAVADALRVAEHGLTLATPRFGYVPGEADPDADDDEGWEDDGWDLNDEGVSVAGDGGDYQRAILARWLRDLAHATGDGERALRAAVQVVRDDPSLADYLGAQTLAGARWPALREELLTHLRGLKTFQVQAKVDVFLHEGLIDDAIAVADEASYSYELVEQVADAAVASQPAWVIGKAREQASSIIENGNAGHYDAAARWVARWRDAARVLHREREWRTYLDDVLERHRRKYKLMPLLRDLVD